jgi:hypothetical protein
MEPELSGTADTLESFEFELCILLADEEGSSEYRWELSQVYVLRHAALRSGTLLKLFQCVNLPPTKLTHEAKSS